jgi:polyhydroxyalkanoate synthesis regulator phasin
VICVIIATGVMEERENVMSTYEDRIANLERKIATLEQTVWQQAQTVKDRTHESAIMLGVLTDDVRLLKESVTSIRIRMNEGFTNLNRDLYSMEEKLNKRFTSLEGRFTSLEGRFVSLEEKVDKRFGSVETGLHEHTIVLSEHTARFDRVETLLTQILARLPEKP